MTVRNWVHLTAADFSSLDRETTLVLLPFGALEQHGPHLPVGTDTLIVEEVIRRVAPRVADLDALVLPTIWCTKSNEHAGYTAAFSLQASTLMALVHDLAASVSRTGFKRLVIMNWHGGNTDLLGALALDLHQQYQLLIFIIDVVRSFINPGRDSDKPQQDYDIHAGQYETGIMLAAYPQLVKPGPYDGIGQDLSRGRLADAFRGYKYLLPEGGPVRMGWEINDLTGDGVVGRPADTSIERGERDLTFMVERVEAILREVVTFNYRR